MSSHYVEPDRIKDSAQDLTEWLAWAYWDMRNKYYVGDDKFASTILSEALIKLARAWELSRMPMAKQNDGL